MALTFQLISIFDANQAFKPLSNDLLLINGDHYPLDDVDDNGRRAYIPWSQQEYNVALFGRTKDDQSVCVTTTFYPSLIIRLPHVKYIETAITTLTTDLKLNHGDMYTKIRMSHMAGGSHLHATQVEFDTFPFLQLYFRTAGLYYGTRKKFRDGKWPKLQLEEEFISPSMQFLQECNLQATGILIIEAKDYQLTTSHNRVSHADIEVSCTVKTYLQSPIIPFHVSDQLAIFDMRVLSFDIECHRASRKGFPEATEPGDCIICIANTTMALPSGRILYRTVHGLGQYDDWKDDVKNDAGQGIPIQCFRYNTEAELLEGWRRYLVTVEQPDLLTGYNIDMFDWNYMHVRATQYFSPMGSQYFYFTNLRTEPCFFKDKSFESKAYGASKTKTYDIPGRVNMDLYTYVRRNFKLEQYKLNFVCNHFGIGQDKDDLGGYDKIFEYYASGDSHLIMLVVKYCLQDTLLPLLLLQKLMIIEALVEMSRTTYTSIQDLLTRGQMYKATSQLFTAARSYNFILTKMPDFSQYGTYQGATVLHMQRGVYRNLTILDFKSLYPSCIIAHNLCTSSWVNTTERLPHITYETHHTDAGDFTFQTSLQGLLPKMAISLLDRRAQAKKDLKAYARAGDMEKAKVMDMRQLALKVSANSLYGFFGALETNDYACLPVAASTTAIGRQLIERSCDMTVSVFGANYGAKVVYGDSVVGDTPILIRQDGKISILPINCLITNFITLDKDIAIPQSLEVWSDQGWTIVQQVIRHHRRPEARLFRITTTMGSVTVTSDHSLLTSQGQKVSPNDIQIGDKLLHHPYQEIKSTNIDLEIGNCSMLYKPIADNILNGCFYSKKKYAQRLNIPYFTSFKCIDLMVAARLMYFCQFIGYYTSLKITDTNLYHVTLNTEPIPNGDKVLEILDVTNDYKVNEFVYDLTTVNHHFQAGPGSMIVHNTDSIMIILEKRPSLDEAFDLGTEIADYITAQLPERLILEFEKVMTIAVMMKKKKYLGKSVTVRGKPGKRDVKGFALVRRDFSQFQRETMRDTVDAVLEDKASQALEVFSKHCQRLINNQVLFEDLIQTRQLAKSYETPIMQKIVADKVEARNPGYGPKPGERVLMVYIDGPDAAPGYQKVEDATYAKEHKIQLDLMKYIRGVKPALMDLFDCFGGDIATQFYYTVDFYVNQARKVQKSQTDLLEILGINETKIIEGPRFIKGPVKKTNIPVVNTLKFLQVSPAVRQKHNNEGLRLRELPKKTRPKKRKYNVKNSPLLQKLQ